jgi:hypothetical protein
MIFSIRVSAGGFANRCSSALSEEFRRLSGACGEAPAERDAGGGSNLRAAVTFTGIADRMEAASRIRRRVEVETKRASL